MSLLCIRKKDKQLTNDYRPITRLPLGGKMFENIVFEQLYDYRHITNHLTLNNQSEFRPCDSTTNQLLFLTNKIHECFEDS